MKTHAISCKCMRSANINPLGKLNNEKTIRTTWILNENVTYAKVNKIILECEKNNLNVETNPHTLNIIVIGFAKDFNNFLKADLHNFSFANEEFHSPNSDIIIPAKWKDDVINILGLDTYPIAKPYVQFTNQKLGVRAMAPRITNTFTPIQIADLYNFPKNLDGAGQRIGIISLGGGYKINDIITYLSRLGINYVPKIIDVSVDGAKNNLANNFPANSENILDIEVIIGIVPKAEIRVYFAPNTYQGFYNAINKAIMDNSNVISISWGAPETLWPTSTMNAFNLLFETASKKNITVLVASGDNGSMDGTNKITVDFPSSSPYVLACGGTTILTNEAITTITEEVVWNNNPTTSATGGGVSSFFTKPTYQSNIAFNLKGKRGVPDISANADPDTGYKLYMDDAELVIGGTSAVAPLWSALIARINQSVGKSVGFVHPILYSNPNACKDILRGNNGDYNASVGWDACSGNGSPNGTEILKLFATKQMIPLQILPTISKFESLITKTTTGTQINFFDRSLNNPTAWQWNFGDKSEINTLANPVHSYKNPGIYDVTLTASNQSGSSTMIKPNYIVVMNSELVASFSVNKTVSNAGSSIKFIDKSNNSSIISWLWDFGDGFTNNATANPYHIYNTAGTYTVKLTVSNGVTSNTITKQKLILIK